MVDADLKTIIAFYEVKQDCEVIKSSWNEKTKIFSLRFESYKKMKFRKTFHYEYKWELVSQGLYMCDDGMCEECEYHLKENKDD